MRSLKSTLDVTVGFASDFGGPSLSAYRGPREVFGIKGEARTFRGEKLECKLAQEEVADIQRILSGLEIRLLPEKPDFSKAKQFPWGLIDYKGLIRGFAVAPLEKLPRRIDDAVESIIKTAAQRVGRNWKPRVRTYPGDDQPVQEVTLSELTADPRKFHGHRVRVMGYYTQAFEDSSLWPDAVTKTAFDARRSVWISGGSAFADKKLFDHAAVQGNQMVVIDGTFDTDDQGHMGMWPGSVQRITRFVLASKQAKSVK